MDLRFAFPGSLLRAITALPFVISTGAQRSGEICGSAVSSWKCFLMRCGKNIPKKEHPHRDLSTTLRSTTLRFGRDDKGKGRYGPQQA
jgi:hypothetical protein